MFFFKFITWPLIEPKHFQKNKNNSIQNKHLAVYLKILNEKDEEYNMGSFHDVSIILPKNGALRNDKLQCTKSY